MRQPLSSQNAASGGFGRRARPAPEEKDARLTLLLGQRLRQKIGNYERAARRLHVSGQTDAAEALLRAAGRLRHITLEA